jgi:hypothetical protein
MPPLACGRAGFAEFFEDFVVGDGLINHLINTRKKFCKQVYAFVCSTKLKYLKDHAESR